MKTIIFSNFATYKQYKYESDFTLNYYSGFPVGM